MYELIKSPEQVARDHYLLSISYPGPEPEAGQFVNIKPCQGTDPLLRRPFSVFNHENNVLEIVVRVVGRGTELICSSQGPVDMTAPRGRGFTLTEKKQVLLVGGGVGNAPLFYLSRKLKEKGNSVTMLYGASSKDYIYLADRFSSSCNDLRIATDDGSRGFHGWVTELAEQTINEKSYDFIYVCGPTVMMEKLIELAGNTPIEVSVENYFGCGIGICSGCVIETHEGNRRACVDGPVFDGKKVVSL